MNPILLVEDEDDHCALFNSILSQTGLRRDLLRARTLEEGCSLMESNPPWVAVVDLGLPDSAGLDAISTIEKNFPEIPLVVLTSNVETSLSVDAIRCGAQDYLVKGKFTADTLLRSLQYAAERHRNVRELARRNREVEAFAAIVSHDLRGPLRRICQATKIVSDALESESDEPVQDWLNTISSQSDRLQTLVNDLLRFSKSGREELLIETFSLDDLLGTVRELLAESISSSHATITLAQDIEITADRGLMTSLLQNLISNSLKFVRDKNPSIWISVKKTSTETEVIVQDNGIGIEEKYYTVIFDPLRRAVGSNEFEGSGLGLGICRRIVEAHEGRIWVTSMVNQGSSFHFTLPRNLEASQGANSTIPTRPNADLN